MLALTLSGMNVTFPRHHRFSSSDLKNNYGAASSMKFVLKVVRLASSCERHTKKNFVASLLTSIVVMSLRNPDRTIQNLNCTLLQGISLRKSAIFVKLFAVVIDSRNCDHILGRFFGLTSIRSSSVITVSIHLATDVEPHVRFYQNFSEDTSKSA